MLKYTIVLLYAPSAGIGRAVAKALAQYGAEVIAFSRTQADLDSLKEEVDIRNLVINYRNSA